MVILPVTQHLKDVQEVREELGLSSTKYPDAAVLAFIHYESRGDTQAISPSGRHFGILQCMDAYVEDACHFAGSPKFPARELLKDPRRSIWVFYNYMERYWQTHLYGTAEMAVMHKGGIGTAKLVRKYILGGRNLDEAIKHTEATSRFAPNLFKYVDDYRKVLHAYAQWVDDQNKPFGVCSPEVMR